MKIKQMKVEDLKPYPNNPRVNDQAVDAVAESISRFGFKVPIIVDKDNVIITGHTRLKAAKKLGLETVPVIMAEDLTPDQVKAFRLADNKTGEIAVWDLSKLDIEMDGMDLKDFGFIKSIEKELEYDFEKLLESINVKEAVINPEYISIRTNSENKEKIVKLIAENIQGYCHVETS